MAAAYFYIVGMLASSALICILADLYEFFIGWKKR